MYAFGFRLPDRYDEWVFHDLNSRGWAIREVARVMLVAVPPIIGIMFLPAGIGLRQHGLLPPSGPDPEFPHRPS